MTTSKFDKMFLKFWGWVFAGISVVTLIGALKGFTWHYYTAIFCAILSGLIFRTIKKDKGV